MKIIMAINYYLSLERLVYLFNRIERRFKILMWLNQDLVAWYKN